MQEITALIRRLDVIRSPALENGAIRGLIPRKPSHSPWAPSQKPPTPERPRPWESPGSQKQGPMVAPKPVIEKPTTQPDNRLQDHKTRNLDVGIRRFEDEESKLQNDIEDKKNTIQKNIEENASDPTKKLPTEDLTINKDEQTLERTRKKKEKLKRDRINIPIPTLAIRSSLSDQIKRIALSLPQ